MSDAFKPNAELGSVVDPLVARYLEASATDNAQPSANVRANVLARAQAIAQENAAASARMVQGKVTPLRQTETKRWWQFGAANDARWQWSAAAAVIAVGVTGWLNYQWTNPDSWQPESRSTTVASAPPPVSAPSSLPAPAQSSSIAIEPAKPSVIARESVMTDSVANAASGKLVDAPSSANQKQVAQVAQAPTEAKAKAQSSAANVIEKERTPVATQSMESSVAKVAKAETADRRRDAARDLDTAAPAMAAAAPAPVAALALPPPSAAPAAPAVAAAVPAKPDAAFSVMRDEPTVAMADTQKRALRSAAPSAAVAAASPPAPPMAASAATAAPTRQATGATEHAGISAQSKTRVNATELLVSAIRSGIVTNISDAIAQGGDVNARMEDGTPLIVYAAKRGDVGAVEQLLRAKAQSNVTDANGKTALDYARARGDVRTMDVLGTR